MVAGNKVQSAACRSDAVNHTMVAGNKVQSAACWSDAVNQNTSHSS